MTDCPWCGRPRGGPEDYLDPYYCTERCPFAPPSLLAAYRRGWEDALANQTKKPDENK